MVLLAEAEILALEESVALVGESLAPKENVAPEAVMRMSVIDSRVSAPAIVMLEPSALTPNFPVEQVHPLPLLSITQCID